MLPNFLCVGAQKSGTTTLWHLLDAHPDVCMARPRETRFFSEPTRFAEGLPAYELRHFAHWDGERAVGEKCPEYLYLPEVPGRLRAALGAGLRLFVCLRSPAQRAYSHYRHNLVQLREARPFEAALAEEAHLLETGTPVAPPFGYLGRGCYGEQVQRYFDVFGSEQCCLISFEALTQHQAAVAGQVYTFLGLAPFAPPGLPVHAGRPPLDALHLWLKDEGEAATVHLWQAQPAAAQPGVDLLGQRPHGAVLIPASTRYSRASGMELAQKSAIVPSMATKPKGLSKASSAIATPTMPSGAVTTTMKVREKLFSCSISMPSTSANAKGMPAAMDCCALRFSSKAPPGSMR